MDDFDVVLFQIYYSIIIYTPIIIYCKTFDKDIAEIKSKRTLNVKNVTRIEKHLVNIE